MRIKRWIVLSLAAALATLMLTGCPWDQDRPGGGASSQPGGDGVIVVPPGGDDDDDGGDDPPVTYTITATAGTGGTAQPATQTVTAGQDASVAVAASDGYCIQQITVDGDVQFTAADASRTEYTVQFPAVDASHTVEASFAQVYTVTASIGAGGTVKFNGQPVADGASAAFRAGDTLTFTVEPDSGYQIASVQAGSEALRGENGSYTYTVKGDCTIAVTFQKQTYTVTVTAGTGGTASVSSKEVGHGGSVTVTIAPNDNYEIKSVQDNGTDVTGQVKNNTYTLANVTADHDITVTFQKLTSYTVTTSEQLMDWAEEVRNGNRSLNCTLAADITLTEPWTPVGTDYQNPYTGTFDGNNHTIRGLTVTGSNEYAGLFGCIGSGGTVKNVKLEDVQITNDNQYANAGGVAGRTNSGATLTACYATGNVTLESNGSDNYFAGGVVGSNGGGTLTACYATGSVTGTGTGTGSIYVGGVTGTNDFGTLTACYHAKGTVSGPDGTTGGVTGRNFKDSMIGGGIITACYWQNDQDEGIGYNQAGITVETTKVDGDWTDAVAKMNKALSSTGYSYQQGNPPKLN